MASFNPQVDLSSIPDIETLNYHPLENRYKTALYIFAVVSTLFFAVVILIPVFVEDLPIPMFVIYIAACLLLLRTIWVFMKITFGFKYKRYALREKDIIYQTGWLWRHSTIVPFNRVQHLRIDQGPIERKFNISRLKIFTAGGNSSDLSIPGLDPITSNKLKQFIVAKTGMDEEE
jgi:membrane protein YdbS with pleckstrin-like domain